MILNSWNNIVLICGNHGEDVSNEMKLQQGPHSLFYSCPQYKSIYGEDHEGRSCNNRLTLVDFEDMLKELTEKSMEGNGFEEVNLTGYRWSKKGILFKVLEHKDGKFKVLMKNNKAIGK